jgi:hypothetical protein
MIVKFPYRMSRRVAARRPRRSKNGTPEERAAKAQGLGHRDATLILFTYRHGLRAIETVALANVEGEEEKC